MKEDVVKEADAGKSFSVKRALPWMALVFPWGMLIAHLSLFWILIPQYEFGWLVPPLALYFFLRRWKSLPQSAPMAGQCFAGLAIACASLLLPVWIVPEAAPHWRSHLKSRSPASSS